MAQHRTAQLHKSEPFPLTLRKLPTAGGIPLFGEGVGRVGAGGIVSLLLALLQPPENLLGGEIGEGAAGTRDGVSVAKSGAGGRGGSRIERATAIAMRAASATERLVMQERRSSGWGGGNRKGGPVAIDPMLVAFGLARNAVCSCGGDRPA